MILKLLRTGRVSRFHVQTHWNHANAILHHSTRKCRGAHALTTLGKCKRLS
jgi:hypothetical protein